MRFLLALLLTMTLSFIAGLYFPWWSLAITSFLVALLIHQKAGFAFLAGFSAIFLLWGGLALYINVQNANVLSQKIATLFSLNGNSILLIVITASLGALVGGFAALSGSFLLPVKK